MTALIGGILLAAGVMLYVLEPVFSGRRAPVYAGEDDYDEGAARRRVALTALRDLAFVMKDGELRTPAAWMTAPATRAAE